MTPTRNSSGTASTNVVARELGGRQPRRLDVGGEHRARRVEDEHHRRLTPLGGDRALRPRERDQQRREREQRQHAPGTCRVHERPATAASRSTFV